MLGDIGDIEKNETEYLSHTTLNNYMDKRLNMRNKSLKLLEENIGQYL